MSTSPAWRWLLAAALALGGGDALAQGDEQQVKAAYVLNFLRFTEWPMQAAPPGEGGAYEIVMVGTRAFGTDLRRIAHEAEALGQRPLRVRRLDADAAPEAVAAALARAHALFLQADRVPDPVPWLRHCRGRAILTIGDGEAFAERGGMLGLVPRGGRIVFDANPAAIQASGLQVSAKVLKLARIVPAAPP